MCAPLLVRSSGSPGLSLFRASVVRYLQVAVLIGAVASGGTAFADHHGARATAQANATCGDTCVSGEVIIDFVSSSNVCNPVCLVSYHIKPLNVCAGVDVTKLHIADPNDLDLCQYNDDDDPEFPITMDALQLALDQTQFNQLMAGDLAVEVELLGGSGSLRAKVEKKRATPTVSEWGLVALALLTLAAGTIVIMNRRRSVT